MLAETQFKTFESALLKIVDIEVVALVSNVQKSVLSSANKVNLKKLEQLEKSLTKIRKNSGPRIKLWGTSKSTERRPDNLFLNITYCCLFLGYDIKQSKATPRTSYTVNLC